MSTTERIDTHPNVGLTASALIGSNLTTFDLNIWRAAQTTIRLCRAGVGRHTAQRADKIMAAGDMNE